MILLISRLNTIIKHNIKYVNKRLLSKLSRKPPWKVLFFGTDDFSIYSLEALNKQYRNGCLVESLQVVTTIKGKPNPVKVYADKANLTVHKWPADIPHSTYDVGLVVSFGHLIPENMIAKFPFGMINVHASLLPRWRGAAPIIYALANGDTRTGITIMKISPKKFDVGQIIAQKSVDIAPDMKMQELHRNLGELGAQTLVQTLANLPDDIENAKDQPVEGVTYAPKVSQKIAQVNWQSMSAQQVYNLSRALDGLYPLQTTWKCANVKLFEIQLSKEECKKEENLAPGFVVYDRTRNVVRILCKDSKYVQVEKLGIVGKKLMSAKDFNNGYLKKEVNECERYFK